MSTTTIDDPSPAEHSLNIRGHVYTMTVLPPNAPGAAEGLWIAQVTGYAVLADAAAHVGDPTTLIGLSETGMTEGAARDRLADAIRHATIDIIGARPRDR